MTSTKFFRFAAVAAAMLVALGLASCTKASFSKSNLYGKWRNDAKTTEYWVYNSDLSGKTWDESEVTEADAQAFTWELTDDNLIVTHFIGGTPAAPKTYTMQTLTSTTMKYTDYTSKTFSFTKVN